MVLDVSSTLSPQMLLVRHLRCRDGSVVVRVRFDPRIGMPGEPPAETRRGTALVCTWGARAISLESHPPVSLGAGSDVVVELNAGEETTFVMGFADRSPLVFVEPGVAYERLQETDRWWRDWSRALDYAGPFRDSVVRSLVTLRLLTYSPSGAPVAAATTSLPEEVGGVRNWDYRFSWPRDASIGVGAFVAVGKLEEARSFMHWLLHAGRLTRPRVEVLYTVHGKPGPREHEIWEVSGYRDSRPVRVGNDASTQHQLDVYGWILDAAYLLAKAAGPLHGEMWRALSGLADLVARRWREPDAGIWEVRGGQKHYVHSKLMAWAALDRALRMSRWQRTRETRVHRWATERDALAAEIRSHGFDSARGCYVWAYGSSDLDASLLLLPVLEFEEQASPRLRGTIDAIRGELGAGGPLLYRYRPGTDGLPGREGAFLPCSFWLVQALARVGEIDAAIELFEDLLALSNDVGLFAEEIDPSNGGHLGNFPQAFTHATLVQAALAIQAQISSPSRRLGA
jgi:GH15 family glucan-1,4-alpha-glucosidase